MKCAEGFVVGFIKNQVLKQEPRHSQASGQYLTFNHAACCLRMQPSTSIFHMNLDPCGRGLTHTGSSIRP